MTWLEKGLRKCTCSVDIVRTWIRRTADTGYRVLPAAGWPFLLIMRVTLQLLCCYPFTLPSLRRLVWGLWCQWWPRSQFVHVSLFSQLYTFCFTLINLWRFRGLVCIPLLPVVAYLAFACSSGYGFVLEFVEDTRGTEMVLVRWHCSTTSLKTTSHGPFLPPMLFWPGCRTSLNRRKEVLPFTCSLRADGGAGLCLPVCVEESGGT